MCLILRSEANYPPQSTLWASPPGTWDWLFPRETRLSTPKSDLPGSKGACRVVSEEAGSLCRLSMGSRAWLLSWKRVLSVRSPRNLVWLQSYMARATSLPYNMLASMKEVSPLIWLWTLFLLLYQAEEGDAVLLTGDAWVIGQGLRWKRSHLHGGPS